MNNTSKEIELFRKTSDYKAAMKPFFYDPNTHDDAIYAMMIATCAGLLLALGQFSTSDVATMLMHASKKTGIPLVAISLGADVAKLTAECSAFKNAGRAGGDE